jgi:hypothetical protein
MHLFSFAKVDNRGFRRNTYTKDFGNAIKSILWWSAI